MTRRLLNLLCSAAVVAGVATVWLVAPPAWSQKSGEKAAEDRKAFRESVLVIRGQIDTTLKALNDIVQGSDEAARKPALKQYGKEVEGMGKQIEKTRDYARKMKERGQDYFKEWEKTMKGVTNPTLQQSATQRRDALKAQYEKIEAGIAKARDDSARFWQDVQDLQKYYSSDLSSEAMTTTAELVKTTNDGGRKIQGYIDEVVKAVDEVGTVMEKPQEVTATEEKPPEEKPPAEEPQEEKTPE